MTLADAALGGGFVVIVVISRLLAQKSPVAYPVLLVVTSGIVSFVPGVPHVALDPNVVLYGFLPPLVYYAGFVTSPRELRANAWSIGLSAFGLVLATTFAVAAVVSVLPGGLSFTGAFLLGAAISPTDPVSATSLLRRLGASSRLSVVLEGESLVNDGIALTLLSLGIASLSAHVSVWSGILDFAKVAGGGTAFGLVVGILAARARRPLQDPAAHLLVSLALPYVAYLPAAALGLSGVLAALTTGLVLGQQPLASLRPAGRLQARAFWEVLEFLLQAMLFVLVGLQLRALLASSFGHPGGTRAAITAITVALVVAVRLLWQFAVPTLRWRPEGRLVDTGSIPRAERLVLGWSGLRGAVTLAAALSVPVTVAGRPYLDRPVIVFVAFVVVVVSLVGEGTSLPLLVRRLGLTGGDEQVRERARARRRLAEASLQRLDELAAEGDLSEEFAEVLRATYERRIELAAQEEDPDAGEPSTDSISLRDARRDLLLHQRDVLEALHREGTISFAVERDLARELDLELARLDA